MQAHSLPPTPTPSDEAEIGPAPPARLSPCPTPTSGPWGGGRVRGLQLASTAVRETHAPASRRHLPQTPRSLEEEVSMGVRETESTA